MGLKTCGECGEKHPDEYEFCIACGASLREVRAKKEDIAKKFEFSPEMRVVGIAGGPFKPHGRGKVLVVGAVFRGGLLLEGVLSTYVETDGKDATDQIVEMINQSRHKGQLRVIMSKGITFAGFNVVDLKEMHKRTGMPVIAVTRKKPHMGEIKRALEHLPDWRERWALIEAAGGIYSLQVKKGASPIYMHLAGTGTKRADAEKIVRLTTLHGLMPEPLRVAYLIATGVLPTSLEKMPEE